MPDLERKFRDLLAHNDDRREGEDQAGDSGNREPEPGDPEGGSDLRAMLALVTTLYAEATEDQKREVGEKLVRAHEAAMEPALDSLARLPVSLRDTIALDALHDHAIDLESRLAAFRSAVRSRQKELLHEGANMLRSSVLEVVDEIAGDTRRGLVDVEKIEHLRRLAKRLLGARPEAILRPHAMLEADAPERGRSKQTPETWEAGTVDGPAARPLVHSSLLYAKGRLAELNRRLWAAQASALLPMVGDRQAELVHEFGGQFKLPLNLSDDNGQPRSLSSLDHVELRRVVRYREELRAPRAAVDGPGPSIACGTSSRTTSRSI